MNETVASALRILHLSDGKPGHDNQARGLIRALAQRCSVETQHILLRNRWQGLLRSRRLPQGFEPDLVIGAGSRTHLGLLIYAKAYAARSIVLMRPSLPCAWFDACLVPQHDAPKPRNNLLTTVGAINAVAPHGSHNPKSTLVLVGGPSKHYQWDSARIVEQVATLAERNPDQQILVADSRRTPAAVLDDIKTLALHNVATMPWRQADAGWLAGELAQHASCWVSPDSVSMVYEALTAGCRVGLLSLPAASASRVARGIEGLVAEGRLVRFADWLDGQALPQPHPLNEAQRCADWILQRWPELAN